MDAHVKYVEKVDSQVQLKVKREQIRGTSSLTCVTRINVALADVADVVDVAALANVRALLCRRVGGDARRRRLR